VKPIWLVFTLLAAALFNGFTPQVRALSCAPPPLILQEMETSDVVFQGKVIRIREEGLAVFQVERAWKGVTTPVFEIYQSGWDPFQFQTEYLVFGSMQDGKLATHICGNTSPWDESIEMKMLSIGFQPVLFNKEPSQSSSERSDQYTLLAGLAILLTALAYLLTLSVLRQR
jgi:hypothetical protein